MRDLWKSFNAELDLMRDLQKSFAAKRKQESVADTSEDLFLSSLLSIWNPYPHMKDALLNRNFNKWCLNTSWILSIEEKIIKIWINRNFHVQLILKSFCKILNRFSFPYISSPYQCMISPKPQSPDNLKANQPQLESSIQSLSDSATNVIQQNVSIFRFSWITTKSNSNSFIYTKNISVLTLGS